MKGPLVSCILAFVLCILVPCPCFAQDPDDIQVLLKSIFNTQIDMVQKLEDIQGRLVDLEETSPIISSTHRSCQESRDIMVSFRDMISTNECEDDSHNCSDFAVCYDQLMYYDCTCLPGYSGDGFTCLDIDECRESSGACGKWERCTNTPGSYHCSCQDGFLMENDTCQDINECELGLSACDPGASCYNTMGSYTCKCKWDTNGDTCTEPHCDWPFQFISDVGCLYIATVDLTWEQARANCEDNYRSKLYEPKSTEEFVNLINYLNETAYDGLTDFIWVGVKGGKWIYSGEAVSDELWREGDPNEGSEAYGYLRKASSYKLGDFSQPRAWTSICRQ